MTSLMKPSKRWYRRRNIVIAPCVALENVPNVFTSHLTAVDVNCLLCCAIALEDLKSHSEWGITVSAEMQVVELIQELKCWCSGALALPRQHAFESDVWWPSRFVSKRVAHGVWCRPSHNTSHMVQVSC